MSIKNLELFTQTFMIIMCTFLIIIKIKMGKPIVLINVLISKPKFISISAVFTTKKAFMSV